MLTVASLNVNGIRAASRRGLGQWLERADPDVLCLQEVRASSDQLEHAFGDGWCVSHSEPRLPEHKGRAGVAVVSRVAPTRTAMTIGGAEISGSVSDGRWVEATFDLPTGPLTVASVYVHTGQADTDKQLVKQTFLDSLSRRWQGAAERAESLILCGDFNVTPTDNDLKNDKGNRGRAGCLPTEREVLAQWANTYGAVDIGRRVFDDARAAGDEVEDHPPYTWWSWRGKAFDNDAGWRIDHQWASANVAKTVQGCWVDRAESYDTRLSDHCPVVAQYAL